jgi:sigma-B regulation protein RsbU (phosphoserine phosphatase)
MVCSGITIDHGQARQPRLTRRAVEVGWVASAIWVLVVLAGIDLTLAGRDNIAGGLVIVPFLASVGARGRIVAGLGGLATVAAIVLARADGLGVSATLACVAILFGGTVGAAWAASLRTGREQRLVAVSTVAEAAQHAILRSPPPRVGSVDVATWYQSSARAATVGGDCYEVLATPYGTRVIVGDVRGHGMPSVRLAALILGGFRALAFTEADLANVARRLDELARRYANDTTAEDVDGEEFVTAVICEFQGSTVGVANCGHPPPLLISPGGDVRRLDASAPTCPLAIGSDPTIDNHELPPGSRLLLYTDGLLEARDQLGGFFDLERAARRMADHSLDTGVASVIDDLNAHAGAHVNDDVALVLLQPGGSDLPSDPVERSPQRPSEASEFKHDKSLLVA